MSEQGPTAQKANNFIKAMGNGPTRLIFIGGIALAFIVVVVAFSTMRSSKPRGDGNAELAGVPTPVAPAANAGTQPINTRAYDELTEQSNAQAVEQARVTGGTAMPVPRVGQAEAEAPEPSVLPSEVDASGQTATATETQQQSQAAQQQYEKAVAERYERMASQFDLLVKRWPQASGRDTVSMRAADPPAAAQSPGSGASSPPAPTPATAAALPDIRANDAFLGVAMSEANTDDPLPVVRAKILNGPAKGSMLMGTIETSQDAPGGLVRFNLLTPADGGPSMSIDAVAIDPRTSRSSVASDVNRHTASRMAALFFSSILSGVSEGLLKGGQQEQVITSGQNVVVQRDAYTDRDLALIGLGKVGTNGSKMMDGVINRRPTVKLNLNTEIGVLFLKDVTLDPASN